LAFWIASLSARNDEMGERNDEDEERNRNEKGNENKLLNI
jgi:hypothetical protein